MKNASSTFTRNIVACGVLIFGIVGMTALSLGQIGGSRNGRSPNVRTPSYRSPESNDAELNSQYGILLEQNIFMAERHKVVPPSTKPSTIRTLAPEQTMVLTGIVLEDGQLRAYVEDRARGQIKKLVIGDSIATGKVSDIQIDAIAYENATGKTWVGIGKTLSGTQFSSEALISNMAEAGVGGGPTTGPSTGSDGSLNTGGLSAEEKMKLRRQQLLGGK